jgi:hypothetical protein
MNKLIIKSKNRDVILICNMLTDIVDIMLVGSPYQFVDSSRVAIALSFMEDVCSGEDSVMVKSLVGRSRDRLMQLINRFTPDMWGEVRSELRRNLS